MSASVEVESSPRTPPQPQASPPGPAAPRINRRVVRGLVCATIAADLVLLGRLTGLLDGAAGVVVAVVLVLLVPTSRELPRRILVAGCLLLGWSQMLWWWPLPVGEPGRVTLGLAVLAGAVAAWVGFAERPGTRARRLRPRLRPADLALALPVGIGIACTGPWLAPKTPVQTLGMLMGGWDNVAHFTMVHMIRRFGATVDALPPPTPGATWQFAAYPQGFHAVAAGVVELLIGPGDDGGMGPELVAYTQAMALVVIAVTTTVVAGFCALPAVRRRPALAAPVAAFVSAVFLLGPGSLAIGGGIANFAVACGLAVAVVLLAVPSARVLTPLTLAAIGGAVVGVASTWVLLLALAGPALLVLVLPLRRRRWAASRARVAVSAGLVVAVLAGLAHTAAVLSRVQAPDPLTIDGGRVHVDFGLVAAAALAIVGMGVALARRHPRVAGLLAMPVAAAATAAGLVALQVAVNGEITYYGLKFLLGTEIVLFAVLPVPVVHLLDRARPRAGLRGALASGIVALALTQVFGLTVTGLGPIGIAAEAPGITNRVKQEQAIAAPPGAAELAARITRLDAPLPAFWVDFPGDHRVSPILAGQWFLALTDTWTLEANAVASSTTLSGPEQVPLVAERILLRRPDAVVVVRGEDVAAVRRDVGPDLAPRIVGL